MCSPLSEQGVLICTRAYTRTITLFWGQLEVDATPANHVTVFEFYATTVESLSLFLCHIEQRQQRLCRGSCGGSSSSYPGFIYFFDEAIRAPVRLARPRSPLCLDEGVSSFKCEREKKRKKNKICRKTPRPRVPTGLRWPDFVSPLAKT